MTTYTDARSGSTQSYSFSYDGAGNLTSDGIANYTWNAADQLTRLTKPGTTIDYTYNSEGLRTSKTVNGTKTIYHWTSSQMVAETDSSGTVIATYTYLPGSYAPESMTRAGVTYHFLKNARGDVTQILSSTGDVVARYTYDPWGSPLSITDGAGNSVTGNPSHIANLSPFRYAGYFWDAESGMYYLQARYYRPDLKRFISVDPEPDENLYAYSKSNPVMNVDPDGELFWFVAIGVAWAAYGAYNYHRSTAKKKRRWYGYVGAAAWEAAGGGKIRAAKTAYRAVRHRKAIKRVVMAASKPGVVLSASKHKQLCRVVEKCGGRVTSVKSGEQGRGTKPHVHVEGFGKKVRSRHIYVDDD